MSRVAVSILSAGLLFLGAGAAVAQEVGPPPVPLVEVSGGYAYMYDTTAEEEFPRGWFFAGATNVTRWFGVAGEVSGAHKTFDDAGFKSKVGLYTTMAGPRFFMQTGRIVPFAQFLVGAAHARATVTFPFEIAGMREFKEKTPSSPFSPAAE